jgi:hypothetical protein
MEAKSFKEMMSKILYTRDPKQFEEITCGRFRKQVK